jgi:hypothetical protein
VTRKILLGLFGLVLLILLVVLAVLTLTPKKSIVVTEPEETSRFDFEKSYYFSKAKLALKRDIDRKNLFNGDIFVVESGENTVLYFNHFDWGNKEEGDEFGFTVAMDLKNQLKAGRKITIDGKNNKVFMFYYHWGPGDYFYAYGKSRGYLTVEEVGKNFISGELNVSFGQRTMAFRKSQKTKASIKGKIKAVAADIKKTKLGSQSVK